MDQRNLSLSPLPPQVREPFLAACVQNKCPVDHFELNTLQLLATFEERQQHQILNRFFLLLPKRNRDWFFREIIKGYRRNRQFGEEYWCCSVCGLNNCSAECTWPRCKGRRHNSPQLTPRWPREAQRLTPCLHFLTKGRCFYGTNCSFAHGASEDLKRPTYRFGGPKNGFQDLGCDLQALFLSCFANYSIRPEAISACVYDSITDFPLQYQIEIVSQFCAEDLNKIKNLSGYVIGIIKKFREKVTEHPKNPELVKRMRSRSPTRSPPVSPPLPLPRRASGRSYAYLPTAASPLPMEFERPEWQQQQQWFVAAEVPKPKGLSSQPDAPMWDAWSARGGW